MFSEIFFFFSKIFIVYEIANIAHAHCMQHTQEYKHALRTCNTCEFSIAKKNGCTKASQCNVIRTWRVLLFCNPILCLLNIDQIERKKYVKMSDVTSDFKNQIQEVLGVYVQQCCSPYVVSLTTPTRYNPCSLCAAMLQSLRCLTHYPHALQPMQVVRRLQIYLFNPQVTNVIYIWSTHS